jgi:HD-GYP domain-containing protein (c-di-GMP phosphodiesterase class II)
MRPINRLTAEINEVEKGYFTVEADDFYSDEFSTLVHGFNHMVKGLEDRETKNNKMNESFFTTLAATLDARDPYTAGHSERVAHYAVEIGKRANMTREQITILKKTGLLHDIGKIAMPDSILLKDGRLTDEEFTMIKQHPRRGEEILLQIEPKEIMAHFIPGVRSHHERIDGLGYPDGLSGNSIPTNGRILAVADAFDAMTSDRPYRKGMSKEKALSILQQGKETQWDSTFVDYLVDWHKEEFGILPEVEKIS